jgi:hypothetical protein
MTLVSEMGWMDSGMLGVDCWIKFQAATKTTSAHAWPGTSVTHFTEYYLLVWDTSHPTTNSCVYIIINLFTLRVHFNKKVYYCHQNL